MLISKTELSVKFHPQESFTCHEQIHHTLNLNSISKVTGYQHTSDVIHGFSVNREHNMLTHTALCLDSSTELRKPNCNQTFQSQIS